MRASFASRLWGRLEIVVQCARQQDKAISIGNEALVPPIRYPDSTVCSLFKDCSYEGRLIDA